MTTGDAHQLGNLAAATENVAAAENDEVEPDDGTPVGGADHQADIERANVKHHHRHDV